MSVRDLTLIQVTKNAIVCGIFMGLLSGCGDDDKGGSADLAAPPSNSGTVNGKSYLNESGDFDFAKAEELFWTEATDNWGDDDRYGHKTVYVAANRDLTSLSVEVNDENGTFEVVTNDCSFKNFQLDNSHPDTWVPGRGSSELCQSQLMKAQKWGSFFTVNIKGFAGLNTSVRGIVFRQLYEVVSAESTENNIISNAIVSEAPKTPMLTEFAKLYLPRQLETEAFRGFRMDHRLFKVDGPVPSENQVFSKDYCFDSGTTDYGRIPIFFSSEVEGCLDHVELDSDRVFMDLMLSQENMVFQMSDSDGYTYYERGTGDVSGNIGLKMTFQPVTE